MMENEKQVEEITPVETEAILVTEEDKPSFDQDLVLKYPKANRRLSVEVSQYGINLHADEKPSGTTTFISPHGLQFKSPENYPEGTLLKIHVTIPDYWERKKRFVDYNRIDVPQNFKLLAKVVFSEQLGKRGKKAMVLCRTVNIDESDEMVLKNYLQEG